MSEQKFGRLPPKDRTHEATYSFAKLKLPAVASVEKTLHLPPLRTYYDQGYLGSCVGASASWQTSIYNNPPTRKYDWVWLYRRAQENDGDPTTNPPEDTGTYVWAAFWALNHLGHVQVVRGKNTPVNIRAGIQSYYWCKTVDEIRTAISMGRPIVLGINWYEDFMEPYKNWIGIHQDWGEILGGHAICGYVASDKRDAIKLVNSWGTGYPLVWIPYKAVERLLSEDGECCVAIDRPELG
jgi:hypothetical protein